MYRNIPKKKLCQNISKIVYCSVSKCHVSRPLKYCQSRKPHTVTRYINTQLVHITKEKQWVCKICTDVTKFSNFPIKFLKKLKNENFWFLSEAEITKILFINVMLYLLRHLLGLFSHFSNQNFYIIRLLKTTHPIEFLDSLN